MRTDLFDFDLPDEAIALEPASPRDSARLLVVRPVPRTRPESPSPSCRRHASGMMWGGVRGGGSHDGEVLRSPPPYPSPTRGEGRVPAEGDTPELEDRLVRDLPDLLRPGDALVLNDTRVIRAALEGERLRGDTKARVSFNLHKRIDASRWRAFARPAKRLAVGDRIRFGHDGRVCLLGTLDATVTEIGEAGEVELSFSMHSAYLDQAIEALGDPPLPPYIAGKRAVAAEDAERYQTVYARREGAVAAPTAGLHFTQEMIQGLRLRGVAVECLTLHVGWGTFQPVRVEAIEEHRVEPEPYVIPGGFERSAAAARRRGGRIIAVGTTTTRALEFAAGEDGIPREGGGFCDLYIRPGHRFRAVEALVTNFHLPESSLLFLVAAFAGRNQILEAYREAVRMEYRFYSYGDAMLIL